MSTYKVLFRYAWRALCCCLCANFSCQLLKTSACLYLVFTNQPTSQWKPAIWNTWNVLIQPFELWVNKEGFASELRPSFYMPAGKGIPKHTLCCEQGFGFSIVFGLCHTSVVFTVAFHGKSNFYILTLWAKFWRVWAFSSNKDQKLPTRKAVFLAFLCC